MLRVLQKLREGDFCVFAASGALLEDLPQDYQAREDEDPENDRLDRRIHEENLFSLKCRQKRRWRKDSTRTPSRRLAASHLLCCIRRRWLQGSINLSTLLEEAKHTQPN